MTTVEKISKQEDIMNLFLKRKIDTIASIETVADRVNISLGLAKKLLIDLKEQGHIEIVSTSHARATEAGRKAWSKTFGSIPRGIAASPGSAAK